MKLLTILSIAVLSTSAYAGDAAVPAAPTMDAPATETTDLNTKWKALDVDGNGTVSKEESAADPDVSGNWGAIDTSQDGAVDPQEFVRFFTKS